MAQTQRISTNNTSIVANDDQSTSVYLHGTEIIRHWLFDRKAQIKTGGWYTPTTRPRLTQCFNEWKLPLRVDFTKLTGNAVIVRDSYSNEVIARVPFDANHTALVRY